MEEIQDDCVYEATNDHAILVKIVDLVVFLDDSENNLLM